MHLKKEILPIEKVLYLITAVVATGIILQYTTGISGNDFWWHIKVGEWILNHQAIPKIGIFSWYAMDNNIEWISHEWLSEVILYLVHSTYGSIGIFLLSLVLSVGMLLIIVETNKQKILDNLLLSWVFLFFSVIIFPFFFVGRPQIFSIYLLYFTLLCLYRYNQNGSKIIYLLPLISILWSNLHGGSANLPYVLCLISTFAGLFGFTYSHLESKKHTSKQTKTLFIVAILSFIFTALNPHGQKMLLYPYSNMGDSMMLSFILEWLPPDAKNIGDIIVCFIPILFVSLILLLTSKKIKFFDLLVFLFFAYMAFRSIRLILLFYIATSLFIFDYFPKGRIQDQISKKSKAIIYFVWIFLLVVNVTSMVKIYNLTSNNSLISTSLETKFVTTLKKDNPKRLFNDYNYSDSLIYNDIPTFFDARADIFTKHNLADAYSLMYLHPPTGVDTEQSQEKTKETILNVEELIEKYKFDAFLLESDRNLTVYLRSHPEKYILILSDSDTSYFTVVPD